MPVDVIMPQMGESIQEGTLVKWLKKPGDTIGRDEPLFEISTDKVDAEIPSPAAGVLKEIKVKEGETVAIKTVVAVIDTEGSAKAGASAPPAEPPASQERPPETATARGDGTKPASAPAPAESPASEERPPESATVRGDGPKPANAPAPARTEPSMPSRPTLESGAPPSGGGGLRTAAAGVQTAAQGGTATLLEERLRTKSSPVVRKIAAEHGVEIGNLAGTGISGRVTKKDILGYIETQGTAPAAQPSASGGAPSAAMEAPRTVPAFAPGERFERVPMTTMRRKIAEHMIMSRRTSAHVSTAFEIDMTRVAKIRGAKKDAFADRHGVNLSFMPFVMKATVDALLAFPTLNASIDGNDVLLKKDIHLGIAVALDWGLIVPVVKNAQDLSLAGLAKSMNDLANRARAKQLKPDEVAGGTFTITNPGIFGSLFGTPIISQPQVAILGVGTIEKRPVVIDDAIAIRTMAYFSISFDHRLIDGAVADQFMARIKKTLQEFDEAQV